MQTCSLQRSGFHVVGKKKPKVKSTAYYLFDEDAKVMFLLDHVSFKARAKRLHVGIMSDGSHDDMTRIMSEMILTDGTVMSIVDLFAEGAGIAFRTRAEAAEVYSRIVKHLEWHLAQMRTNITYVPPPVEDFQNMSEFATIIRPWAKDHNSDIDEVFTRGEMHRMLPVRPSFSYALNQTERQEAPAAERPTEVPKSISKMDQIEKMLERMNGYSS